MNWIKENGGALSVMLFTHPVSFFAPFNAAGSRPSPG